MRNVTSIFILSIILIACSSRTAEQKAANAALISQFDAAITQNLLQKWYPLVIDYEYGGFYSDINKDFTVGERQDKMIVSQARHIWTTAKAAELFGSTTDYMQYARHGFKFLRDQMWDSINGGFFNLVSREGLPLPVTEEPKTAYGNAFAIYGLSAYYKASKDPEALDYAKKTFYWLETHSHDTINKGYFQSLSLDGSPVQRTDDFPSNSTIGYKDQNSSIHLLEAFTSLYQVWPDELLAKRLKELLMLIRDTITTEKGYMHLFFTKDWKPISFKDSTDITIKKHYYLDHVSFGHDVETAFLLLEAADALGEQHSITLEKGKRMVDHALETGWDNELGGFYDGGYYFKGKDEITIVNDNKNWWTQAEGLNSLLLFSQYYPEDPKKYRARFDQLWEYTNTYLLDDVNGGWYEWGTDKRPQAQEGLKGHIWKATYHNYRSLANCKLLLERAED
ncbi:AGE family epimerase/isomerase [Muriicola sp. Z0-33]|uniref:AGE family epimerase/isomerase n=1 Tax=Muriicola sp. Z0-33 TaxID=2816957 RepID=UPI0022390EE0|nr:AGE family epimerase/isomerase [Muriicola sp. Z0-33]MCW5515796.1 AGE family epimerase/isomerase [Muriicola sp. Z0-33]